jgi:hypothetical protein
LARIRDYLAVKRERTAGLPTSIRHTELNVERKEGSASIVGFEIAALAFGRPLHEPYDQLVVFMAEPPESFVAGQDPFPRFRMRAFGAGAAAAWVLTRLKAPWRERIQKGASFETLLTEAAKFDPLTAPKLAAAAKARLGYDQLLADAKTWSAKVTPMTLAQFLELRPFQITVEFPKLGPEGPSFTISGTGFDAVPEPNLLLFPRTDVAKLDYGPIRLHSEGRPIAIDQRRGPVSYKFTLMADALAVVSGFDGESGGTVTGKALELKIDAPATVTRSGNTLTIKMRPKTD